MVYLGTKFRSVLLGRDYPLDPRIEELKSWCTEFYEHGFTPEYEGGSAGNLSFRTVENENAFIITGAGIISKLKILDNSLVLVNSCDIEKEIVYYYGTRKPSSETMVHAAIYQEREDVGAVFHGHSESILAKAEELGLKQTRKEEAEGTNQLAKAVKDVLGDENFIVMKDHGFISLGEDMKEAGKRALEIQKNALGI